MAFIRRMSFGWNCLWTKLVQSIFKVMDFTFTRMNLHLLEDYIYYNLQLCLLWIDKVTIIIDLIWRHSTSLLFIIIKDRFYEDIFIYCIYLSIYLWYFIYLFVYLLINLFITYSFIFSIIYLLESYVYWKLYY